MFTDWEVLMTKKAAERATMTIDEAAHVLGVGRASAYEAARRGDLPVLRVGRRWLVSRAGLERFVQGAEA
jgi:excisionase family DNA binding protein